MEEALRMNRLGQGQGLPREAYSEVPKEWFLLVQRGMILMRAAGCERTGVTGTLTTPHTPTDAPTCLLPIPSFGLTASGLRQGRCEWCSGWFLQSGMPLHRLELRPGASGAQ